MKRGLGIGIGIGIAIVAIIGVFVVSGFESMVENDDQIQTQVPSGDNGEGQRFHITLEDSAGSADNP